MPKQPRCKSEPQLIFERACRNVQRRTNWPTNKKLTILDAEIYVFELTTKEFWCPNCQHSHEVGLQVTLPAEFVRRVTASYLADRIESLNIYGTMGHYRIAGADEHRFSRSVPDA